jgi:hypothetical protein
MIPVVTPIGQMEPVARSIRSEAAHRNAVREIGPRPDRLAALAPTNQVGRPSGLGMEAEASLKEWEVAQAEESTNPRV